MDFDVFFRFAIYSEKILQMKIGGMKKKENSDDVDVESAEEKMGNEAKQIKFCMAIHTITVTVAITATNKVGDNSNLFRYKWRNMNIQRYEIMATHAHDSRQGFCAPLHTHTHEMLVLPLTLLF